MSRKINLGNIEVYVEDTYEDMSKKAADIFAKYLDKDSVLGFATGSTPVGLYKELIRKYEVNEIDFSGITTFNLDEYYPIKKDNNQSYDYFMRGNLFNYINVNEDDINIPNGEAEDPILECERYEKVIESAGGIDVQILGIGLNGHIGFNEPSDLFTKDTNYIELSESTINANSRFFESEGEVPRHALTMGIKSIMKAKKILLLVNSAKKAEILAEALTGDITPRVPASILQLHPDVTAVVDEEAASHLGV